MVDQYWSTGKNASIKHLLLGKVTLLSKRFFVTPKNPPRVIFQHLHFLHKTCQTKFSPNPRPARLSAQPTLQTRIKRLKFKFSGVKIS